MTKTTKYSMIWQNAAFGPFVFPSAMAPEPVFRLCNDVFFKPPCVNFRDRILVHQLRKFAKQFVIEGIKTSFDFADSAEYYREVVFPGIFFSAVKYRRILVQKFRPVATVNIGRALVNSKNDGFRYSEILFYKFPCFFHRAQS